MEKVEAWHLGEDIKKFLKDVAEKITPCDIDDADACGIELLDEELRLYLKFTYHSEGGPLLPLNIVVWAYLPLREALPRMLCRSYIDVGDYVRLLLELLRPEHRSAGARPQSLRGRGRVHFAHLIVAFWHMYDRDMLRDDWEDRLLLWLRYHRHFSLLD